MDTTLMYVLATGSIVLAAIVEFYILYLVFKGFVGTLRISLRKTSVLANQRLHALKHELYEQICRRRNQEIIDDDDHIYDAIAWHLTTLSIKELKDYNDKYKLPNDLNLYVCRLYYALGLREDPCLPNRVVQGNLIEQLIIDAMTRNVFSSEFRV